MFEIRFFRCTEGWGAPTEGSDIYRDISFGVNIEGFEAYRCIGVTLWG